MQDLSPSPYYIPAGQCIAIYYPSLSDKPSTASAELCCTSGDTHSKNKGTYNTSFVSAALASCKIQFTLQDPVSHIQSIEWNHCI